MRSFVERSDHNEIGYNFRFLRATGCSQTITAYISRAYYPGACQAHPCYAPGFADYADYRRYPLYKNWTSAQPWEIVPEPKAARNDALPGIPERVGSQGRPGRCNGQSLP